MDSELIQVVNKLQDTFATLGGELDMPQIVVVGSQSAGKSSVLETIVGRDFLPRGQGIVTRRPLVLQLIHTSSASPSEPGAEYAQFLHMDKRFTDFSAVRREIESETLRVAGQNKGVSKLPINLRIYSPNVLDLTLVDLPGLTKIPVGDQPSDIERQIRNLVLDYISKPNSVILSVSPANVDLANSDSLKLARSVDPQGRRTIGVLTKLDLMDAGTNAVDILNGRVYPLKLGFIGVVNRSQQDINSERTMESALAAETEFFANHPAYRNMSHRNGTKYLAKTLNQVLMNHIRDKLPDMKARLNTLMGQTQQELNALGDTTLLGGQNQGALILRLMTQFARDFVDSIEGHSLDISTKELSGGARIYYIFHDVFGNALQSIDTNSNLTLTDIKTAIRNSAGPRASLFVPEAAFDLLVKPQIKLLEAPSLRCVEMVYEELVKICHNCTSPELQRFPRLHAQIIDVVSELLRERLGPTSDYTSSLIAIEAAYINTNHPAFIAGTASAASTMTSTQSRKRIPAEDRSSAFDDDAELSEPLHSSSQTNSSEHGYRFHSFNMPLLAKLSNNRSGGHNPSKPRASFSQSQSASIHQAAGRENFLNYFFGGATSQGPGAPTAGWGSRNDSSKEPNGSHTSSNGFSLPPNRPDRGSPAFDMKSLGKHIEVISGEAGPPLNSREEMETSLIRSLIATYFDIVRQTVQDLVPKAIMHFLVNNTSQQVQNRLVTKLYQPDLFAELLDEDETLVNERARVKSLLDAYREAFKLLSEISLKPTSL
ncbi:dynamin protein dnm1 [Clavulina sp. PMI_390]|nr:dynamin protein dnm1 [Clavulina sp. PMI_390]